MRSQHDMVSRSAMFRWWSVASYFYVKHNELFGDIFSMDAHDKQNNAVTIEHVISVGMCGGKAVMRRVAITEHKKDVLHIKGKATEYDSVPPKKGAQNQKPTTYIKGAFDAYNLLEENPVKHLSGQIILPDSISGFVCGMIQPRKSTPIDLIITVEEAENSITGYKFSGRLLNYSELVQEEKPEVAEAKPDDAPNATPFQDGAGAGASEVAGATTNGTETVVTEPKRGKKAEATA